MTSNRKDELRAIIASGRNVTSEEYEEMTALFPPEVYQLVKDPDIITGVMHVEMNVSDIAKKYVVYVNTLNGQDFWIGVCKFAQLFSFPTASRNNVWRQIVKKNDNVSTTVLQTFDNRAEAAIYRDEMMNKKTYHANKHGLSLDYNKVNNSTPVLCVDDGNEFLSIADAAMHYDVSTTLLSNHLNDKPYYKTVRGLKFIRI